VRTEVVELQNQLKSLQQVAPLSEGSESPKLPVPPPVAFTEQEKQAEDKRLEALFAPDTKLDRPQRQNPGRSLADILELRSPKGSGKKWLL